MLIQKGFELPQEKFVERRGTADVQRKPVAHEWVAFSTGAQAPSKMAADPDPVLGRDFQKIDCGWKIGFQRA